MLTSVFSQEAEDLRSRLSKMSDEEFKQLAMARKQRAADELTQPTVSVRLPAKAPQTAPAKPGEAAPAKPTEAAPAKPPSETAPANSDKDSTSSVPIKVAPTVSAAAAIPQARASGGQRSGARGGGGAAVGVAYAMERRKALDNQFYTKDEFVSFFGGMVEWNAAKPAAPPKPHKLWQLDGEGHGCSQHLAHRHHHSGGSHTRGHWSKQDEVLDPRDEPDYRR